MSFASETRNELARVQADKKCCMLAEIAGKADPFYPSILLTKPPDDRPGSIRRTVIDQNDLMVVLRHPLHGLMDLRHHMLQCML